MPARRSAAPIRVVYDRHLTYLMRQDTSEGIDFCRRFPGVKIVDPPLFLAEIRKAAMNQP